MGDTQGGGKGEGLYVTGEVSVDRERVAGEGGVVWGVGSFCSKRYVGHCGPGRRQGEGRPRVLAH